MLLIFCRPAVGSGNAKVCSMLVLAFRLLTLLSCRGPYDPLKVDVWSLGATVWEMAEAQPPFAEIQDPRKIGNQWPSLTQPEVYSRSFHDFLRLCSQTSSVRPKPHVLSDVRYALHYVVVHSLISFCTADTFRPQCMWTAGHHPHSFTM